MITIEKIQDGPKDKKLSVYLVKRDDVAIGMLEKYNNTRTERHPWKAIRGIGFDAKFAGAFYDRDGGRDAAIRKVIGG